MILIFHFVFLFKIYSKLKDIKDKYLEKHRDDADSSYDSDYYWEGNKNPLKRKR